MFTEFIRMLTEPFKVAAPEICGGEIRHCWS